MLHILNNDKNEVQFFHSAQRARATNGKIDPITGHFIYSNITGPISPFVVLALSP